MDKHFALHAELNFLEIVFPRLKSTILQNILWLKVAFCFSQFYPMLVIKKVNISVLFVLNCRNLTSLSLFSLSIHRLQCGCCMMFTFAHISIYYFYILLAM